MKREVLTSTNTPLSLFSMYTHHHQQSLSKNQFAPNHHFSLSLSTFFSSFLFSLLACYSKSLIPYSPLKSPLIPPHLPSLIPPEKEPLYSFWYLYHLVKLDLSLSTALTHASSFTKEPSLVPKETITSSLWRCHSAYAIAQFSS